MVSVTGTKGNAVQVEVLGIAEVMRMLRAKGKQIAAGADLGVVRAGTYIQEEVKESIMGNRAEHKSVDTGEFVNSVEFIKTGKAKGKVESKVPYAKNLEYGTSKMAPRRHFGNTKTRNQMKVKTIIDAEIKGKMLKNI